MGRDWRKLSDYVRVETNTIKGLEKWQEIGIDIDGNVNFYHNRDYWSNTISTDDGKKFKLIDKLIGVKWNDQPEDIKQYEEALMKWNTLRTWYLLLKDEAKWYNIVQQSIRGQAPGKYNGFKTISEFHNHLNQCERVLLTSEAIEIEIKNGWIENILLTSRINGKTKSKLVFAEKSEIQSALISAYMDRERKWVEITAQKIFKEDTIDGYSFLQIKNYTKELLQALNKNSITGKSIRNTGRKEFYKKLSVLKKWLGDANLVETRNEAVEFIVNFLGLHWEDQNQLRNFMSNNSPKEAITIKIEQLIEYQSILFWTKRQK